MLSTHSFPEPLPPRTFQLLWFMCLSIHPMQSSSPAPANSYTIVPGIPAAAAEPASVRLLDATPGGTGDRPQITSPTTPTCKACSRASRCPQDRRRPGLRPHPGPWRYCRSDVRPGGVAAVPRGKTASTYYHPVDTREMGTHRDRRGGPLTPGAARVLGGCLTADASTVPNIVSANPNATITMIGAKAAEPADRSRHPRTDSLAESLPPIRTSRLPPAAGPSGPHPSWRGALGDPTPEPGPLRPLFLLTFLVCHWRRTRHPRMNFRVSL